MSNLIQAEGAVLWREKKQPPVRSSEPHATVTDVIHPVDGRSLQNPLGFTWL